MSPILVRPVREQLEHDRVIRLLQVRLKRRNDVTTNIGEDQTTSVRIGQVQIFPDLVLTSTDRGHKLMGTVEVETAESVNHLEAMAQWAHLGRARAPFHLYVPAGSVDIARRLAAENQVNVAEIWSYHTIGDQTRFTMVHRSAPVSEPRRVAAAKPARPAASSSSRSAAPARGAKTSPRKASPSRSKTAARKTSRARKRGNSPATSEIQPRQTRVREHVCRAYARLGRPASRKVTAEDSVLVPHAARCANRPFPPSMRMPFGSSSNTIPTSSSIGREFSKVRTIQPRRDRHLRRIGNRRLVRGKFRRAVPTYAGRGCPSRPNRRRSNRLRHRLICGLSHKMISRSTLPLSLRAPRSRRPPNRPKSKSSRTFWLNRGSKRQLLARRRETRSAPWNPAWVRKDSRDFAPGTRKYMARISETVPDPARQEELKARAERLNPDTWVTEAEVSDRPRIV